MYRLLIPKQYMQTDPYRYHDPHQLQGMELPDDFDEEVEDISNLSHLVFEDLKTRERRYIYLGTESQGGVELCEFKENTYGGWYDDYNVEPFLSLNYSYPNDNYPAYIVKSLNKIPNKVVNYIDKTYGYHSKPFPKGKLKVLDVRVSGNAIHFYFGDITCNDYTGEDWTKYSWVDNYPGVVNAQYVKAHWVWRVPDDYIVRDIDDWIENKIAYTSWIDMCREDFKTKVLPIAIIEKRYDTSPADYRPVFMGMSSKELYDLVKDLIQASC